MKRSLRILALYLACSTVMFVITVSVSLLVDLLLDHHIKHDKPDDWIDYAIKGLMYGALPFVLVWLKERKK